MLLIPKFLLLSHLLIDEVHVDELPSAYERLRVRASTPLGTFPDFILSCRTLLTHYLIVGNHLTLIRLLHQSAGALRYSEATDGRVRGRINELWLLW